MYFKFEKMLLMGRDGLPRKEVSANPQDLTATSAKVSNPLDLPDTSSL